MSLTLAGVGLRHDRPSRGRPRQAVRKAGVQVSLVRQAGSGALEELPHTLPTRQRVLEYTNPPKQQGGPRWSQGRHEAKCNREQTSQTSVLHAKWRVLGQEGGVPSHPGVERALSTRSGPLGTREAARASGDG